jgi:muramoyltetrapeptide carboxypeptidase
MIPKKLTYNDEVRVISPSKSLSIHWITTELVDEAKHKISNLGLKTTFGENCRIINEFESSSIMERITDLHNAFKDTSVKIIMTSIGGFNSNELLPYIDFDLIKQNPKILCGYSDISVLCNAIYAKAGLVTYYGPHFSDFGEIKNFTYTEEFFKKCLFSNEEFKIESSEKYSEDKWAKNQNNRVLIENKGHIVIQPGEAEGFLIGGCLGSFRLLQGTEYFPNLKGKILLLEDTGNVDFDSFIRYTVSLSQMNGFDSIKGVLIGRFHSKSKVNIDLLKNKLNEILPKKIPVIANLDFGHTSPKLTLPIGGKVKIDSEKRSITVIEH